MDEFDEDVEVIALLHGDKDDVLSLQELRSEAGKDEEISALRNQLLKGFPRSAKYCSELVKPYFHFNHELHEVDGLIIRGEQQVIVPATLRDQYLRLAHCTHDGIVRTKQLLRSLAWWPRMDKAVEDMVRECAVCQSSDRVLLQRTRVAPLHPVPIPATCWSKLGIDVVGPIHGAPHSARFAITLIY